MMGSTLLNKGAECSCDRSLVQQVERIICSVFQWLDCSSALALQFH